MPPSSRGGMGLMSSLMGPKSAASFRPKEKYLIFLVLATFCFVCFGAIFFLPNTDSKSGEKTLIVFFMSSPGSKIGKKREKLSNDSNLKYLIFLLHIQMRKLINIVICKIFMSRSELCQKTTK